jgi:hypothetical protein
LAEGLRALELGEVTQILKKASIEGEKRNYSERLLQLQAIEYIEYQAATGQTKERAREIVRTHFGVDQDAVRKWERALRNSLGASVVSRAITRAKEVGELVRHLENKGVHFEPKSYFDEMKRAGTAYKEALKAKKQSRYR